jgi:hypothetical protein
LKKVLYACFKIRFGHVVGDIDVPTSFVFSFFIKTISSFSSIFQNEDFYASRHSCCLSSTSVLAAPLDVDIRDIDAQEDFTAGFDENYKLGKRANLPGLNAVQTRNARAIIAEVKKEKLGIHGCQTAITTALTEVRAFGLLKYLFFFFTQ